MSHFLERCHANSCLLAPVPTRDLLLSDLYSASTPAPLAEWPGVESVPAYPRPRLPVSAERTTFRSNPVPKSETPKQLVDEDQAWLDARSLEEKQAGNKIVVVFKPVKWHPAVLPLRTWLEGCITKYRHALAEKERRDKSPKRSAAPDFSAWDIGNNDSVLGRMHRSVAMRVSLWTYDRALAIFNSLAYAAEERGFKVELTEGPARLRFSLETANLYLYITERLEETFVSVLNAWDAKPHMEKKLMPTGRLRINIDRGYAACQINATADSPLEGDLNRVFEYGYSYVIKSRENERLRLIERQKAEVQRLQRKEAELQRKAEEQHRAEGQRRLEVLLQQAGGLDKAETIRRLVDALDRRLVGDIGQTEKFKAWRIWALEVAAVQDPTNRLFELLRDLPNDHVDCATTYQKILCLSSRPDLLLS